jgi:hypothetical protein
MPAPYGIELIPNAKLQRSDIPSRGSDWEIIKKFARTFDGFAELGFERCAEFANDQRVCVTLSESRGRLFFEYRRYNHFGHPPDANKLEELYKLLELMRQQVAGG